MRKKVKILFLFLLVFQFSRAQSSYVIETKVNDLKITQNNGNDIITLINGVSSDSIGNPMLPIKKLKIAIPSNNEVSGISIVDIQEQEITGKFNIAPVQEPLIADNLALSSLKKNDKTYSSNLYYPINSFVSIDRGYMSGVNILSVNYYPIKYNPVTKRIKIITKITFKLNYNTKKDESVYSTKLSSKSYNYIQNRLKNLVINPTEIESNSISNPQKSSPLQKVVVKPTITTIDYVIITNDAMKDGFQEIANWKSKTGLTSKVVTTEWISQNFSGNDMPEKIRTFIKYAYQNWGAIWYLLGGDNQVIPVRYAWVSPFCQAVSKYNPNGVFIPSDMYYSCLDGNWNADGDMTFGEGNWNRSNNGTFINSGYNIDNVDRYCDVFIGRIPVENNTELIRYKTKYFEYLRGTNVNATKALVFSANSDAILSSHMDNVAQSFPSATTFVDKVYECIGSYQTHCGTKSDVLNAFNSTEGYHIICGYGHGNPQHFEACFGEINNNEIDEMQNSKRGQILYNNHCETLALDADCVGEHYMTATNGGVVYIGNTRYGWVGDPSIYNNQFIYNIYQSKRLGEALYNAKGTGSTYDSTERWGFFALNLLGDPEMPVWTNTPKTFNSTDITVTPSPSVVVCGNATIVVGVNNLSTNGHALISLRKGEEINISSEVNVNGDYTFNVNPKTVGQIEITVTEKNYIPFEATILVSVPSNENLYISNVTIDDDLNGNSHGNGNHQIDAGETIELSVELTNNGLETADNVGASISSTSPHINLISTQSDFGSITSNNNGVSISKFVFTVDKDTPELLKDDIGAVKFILQIFDGNGTDFVDAFNVDIHASDIKLGNRTIISTTNGNSIIEPNETVTLNIDLKNIGKAEATGLTAVLTGNNSNITPRTYPNLASFETEPNEAVFQFTINGTVPNPLNFHLQVQNEYLKTWDLPDFNLLETTDKVGNLNFTADVTEIDLSWGPIPNIEGYNVYRCNVDTNDIQVGDYIKLNDYPISSTFYNDINLGLLTHYRYKVSAVSLTGNEGEYSDSFLAWTSVAKEIFPLDFGAIRGGITAADINNDGYKEIFGATKSGYIIGLDHEFKELYNIDDNITTQGAYAFMQTEVWGTPAVGDLHKKGQNQIVDCSINGSPNRVYCFSGNNTFENHNYIWRNDLPTGSIKGVVLSNLDNSSDGSLESIVAGVNGPNAITIYDADGNLKTTINSSGTYYDQIAVADIDGAADGCKEIIRACGTGIYIWNHDGTPYKNINGAFYTIPSGLNLTFQGSPIVCNIDNVGYKEIIVAATNGSSGKLFAIRTDIRDSQINDWNPATIPTNGLMSVGDLNHDGKLEIVALGNNAATVLNNKGEILYSKTDFNSFTPAGNPILADLDDDSDVEILFGSAESANKNIYVYNMDLTSLSGFPVNVQDVAYCVPTVSDIDNDGKNEIILGVNNSIDVWRTEGNPANIEWGSERHDQYNTGEYQTICDPTLITSDATWNANQSVCGDLIVKSGTLTINSGTEITLESSSMIIVMSGASLVIDGSNVLNANIRAMAGSNVTIKNNGRIVLRSNAEFYTETGTNIEIQYGSIDK